MNEIWKDIEGYEGLYQVSNMGNVKVMNYCHSGKEKLMRPSIKKLGYKNVTLSKNDVKHTYLLHRLVAKAFIPNPNNLPYVNHKDCNPSNNCVDNLEWCTPQYNSTYGNAVQKRVFSNSTPVKQLSLNGTLITIWSSAMEAGRNGYDFSAIRKCCLKQYGYKTHKGFRWEL